MAISHLENAVYSFTLKDDMVKDTLQND